MNEGRAGRQVDLDALKRYILGSDSTQNLSLLLLLWLTLLPTVFVPIPKDKKLQSKSHFSPNTKMKQALSGSPGRGENINWAEIQNTQGGEVAMKYQ